MVSQVPGLFHTSFPESSDKPPSSLTGHGRNVSSSATLHRARFRSSYFKWAPAIKALRSPSSAAVTPFYARLAAICLFLRTSILSDDGVLMRQAPVGTLICELPDLRSNPMHDVSPQSACPVTKPLLRAIGITKRYGSFLANDGIDLDLFPAEIHALLGENGAGKSTLVKIMYGLIQPSEGELRWMGQKIVLAGPSEARSLGIGMVFQHFSLFENLTVAENVALGLAPTESFAVDFRAAGRDRSGLRLAAGSQAGSLAALGRRTAAHRDRARADAKSQASDS